MEESPMRTALVALLILALGQVAMAQTPYFQIYFDDAHTMAAMDCPPAPPGTVLDTLHVVAHNFNNFIIATEFSIDYSSKLTWLGDITTADVVIGNSPIGISQAWQYPLNAFTPLRVMSAQVLWMCSGCAGSDNTPVVVMPNPDTDVLAYVSWPGLEAIPAVGMTSLICATVPVEETSWGRIKALYRE
jgi:hypothetical protein